MNKWIHFTDDLEKFPTGQIIQAISSNDPAAFTDVGLCVYRYNPDREDEMATAWQRLGVVIECSTDKVELLQENPLDDDPDYDEYIISTENFAFAVVKRGW